jgi:hypothetical protein
MSSLIGKLFHFKPHPDELTKSQKKQRKKEKKNKKKKGFETDADDDLNE